jgi:hypothetical protein
MPGYSAIAYYADCQENLIGRFHEPLTICVLVTILDSQDTHSAMLRSIIVKIGNSDCLTARSRSAEDQSSSGLYHSSWVIWRRSARSVFGSMPSRRFHSRDKCSGLIAGIAP